MTVYRVMWVADINAETPEEAVDIAHNKYINPTRAFLYNACRQCECGEFHNDEQVAITRENPSVH